MTKKSNRTRSTASTATRSRRSVDAREAAFAQDDPGGRAAITAPAVTSAGQPSRVGPVNGIAAQSVLEEDPPTHKNRPEHDDQGAGAQVTMSSARLPGRHRSGRPGCTRGPAAPVP